MKKLLAVTLAVFFGLSIFGLPIALGASNTYYAKTLVYFDVPSDASFSISMPSDYNSWTSITGTTEGTATSTDWISFNYTSATNATLVQPYQLGAGADAQDGSAVPIFYVDNTGNVNEQFDVKLNDTEPTGIELYFNATGGTSPTTTLTRITTSYQMLTTSLSTTQYLNVTLYSNVTGALGGVTERDVYIRSTGL